MATSDSHPKFQFRPGHIFGNWVDDLAIDWHVTPDETAKRLSMMAGGELPAFALGPLLNRLAKFAPASAQGRQGQPFLWACSVAKRAIPDELHQQARDVAVAQSAFVEQRSRADLAAADQTGDLAHLRLPQPAPP